VKEGWDAVALGNLCTVFADGDWIESKDQSLGGIRLIQTGNIGEGQFKDRGEKARYVSEGTFSRLRCTEIFEGDCLISRLPDPVGRSCILPDTGERMITAVDCTIVRFNKTRFLPKFFNYYSQSSEYLVAVDSETTGTTRSRISRSKLAQTPVPVPPLTEQQRIVAILDAAFADLAQAKANAEKNLANAKELFSSELNSIFTRKGEGWVEKILGDLATFRNGINFTKTSNGKPIKILGVKDFQSNFWMPQKELDTVTPDGIVPDADTLNENDLVFVRSNGNPELIGRCVLVGKISERTTHSGFTIRARLHSKEISPRFLCHLLKSGKTRKEMIEGGNGVNIKSLNQGTLSRLSVSLPSLNEQATIIEQLGHLQAETQHLESLYQRKLIALDELKQSLLQKAFSGDL
jgi:type I restriction enzyme S subunit